MGGQFNFKTVAALFGVVLALYLIGFYGIEHWRGMNGPWILQFNTNQQGHPVLFIEQGKMGVHDLQLVFPEETSTATNLPVRLVLDRPRQPLPFGERLHEDLVKLPGVETIELFGHVVELAPRRLAIDGRALPWTSAQIIELWATNKPSSTLTPAGSLQDTY